MAEPVRQWLVEEGIAEHRAIRLSGGRIAEAAISWPDRLNPGSVVEAKLIVRQAGSPRGTALVPTGEEVLVDRLPRDAAEGASLRLSISRAASDGPGRAKRAQGRPSEAPLQTLSLADSLRAEGAAVSVVRRFPMNDWDELVSEALTGEIGFAGGSLLLFPTPALTAVDVDGTLAGRALALAAAQALGEALPRLAIGGSVAVDFPTLGDKADRRAVDTALAQALEDWPHERTAMNGFGLVQLVARSKRPSLLQLGHWRRDGLVWRRLLRRAEMLDGAGVIELSIHPRLEREVAPDHIADLERRSGRRVRLSKLTALAPEAPNAQLVSDE